MLRPIQWQIAILRTGQEAHLSKDAASSASQFAMRQEAVEESLREQEQVKRKENTSGTNRLGVNDKKLGEDGGRRFKGKGNKKKQAPNDKDTEVIKNEREGLDIYA